MKKLLKVLKIVSFILSLIILIEVFYIVYVCFFKPSKSIYFDSINSFEKLNNGYVAVGSNNDNQKHLEKAKISVYDEKGERLLERIYNKGYNSVFFDIVCDNDAYVAVGSYEEEYENSLRRALIVKYDKDGNIIFEKDFGTLDNSKFLDIAVVEDGYLVVGQSVYDSMSVGFSEKGGAVLIKYSKFGEELWRGNFGSNKEAIYNSILVDGSYIYVVGKDSDNEGIISKYSLDGTFVNSSSYETTDGLGFTSIIKNDYIYVSGADSNKNALLVKYDSECRMVDKVIYNQVNSRFNKIMFDENGDIIAIGNENDVVDYDGLLAKYNKDLDLIKGVTYGEDSDDYFTDIVLEDNNYIVSGYSSYDDSSYLSKFITYSDALKVLDVK